MHLEVKSGKLKVESGKLFKIRGIWCMNSHSVIQRYNYSMIQLTI